MKFFSLLAFCLLLKFLSSSAEPTTTEHSSSESPTGSSTDNSAGSQETVTKEDGKESSTNSLPTETSQGSSPDNTGTSGQTTSSIITPSSTDTPAGQQTSEKDLSSGTAGQTPAAITPSSLSKSTGQQTSETDGKLCQYFDKDLLEKLPINPSGKATVTCGCKSRVNNACPSISANSEALKNFHIAESSQSLNESCNVTWSITVVLDNFKQRRVQILLTCDDATEDSKTENLLLTFEKKANGEPCDEDVDCFSSDQVCNDKKCMCYPDKPSYNIKEDTCYPAVGYQEHCICDEQCITNDPNTLCQTGICKCRENYWPTNNTFFKCVTTASAAKMSLNRLATVSALVVGIAVFIHAL